MKRTAQQYLYRICLIASLSFALLLPDTINGQMHDNNWIFGYTPQSGNANGTLMHFENGYPEFNQQNIQQDYKLYCIICSDSTGNLLFHTDGRQIRNRLHQVMEGGEMINPGQMWVQFPDGYPSATSGICIPAPGLPNHYYLIHTTLKDGDDLSVLCPELLYSLIDMNANSGLGKVVLANQVLTTGDLPNPRVVKHANGRDWWLLVGDIISKKYLVYLIGPNGIQLSHVQEIASPSVNSGNPTFSGNGCYYVNNYSPQGLWIFDFDRCSGTLSMPRFLPYQQPVFWTSTCVFSSDERFLYVSNYLVSYQLDMNTIDSETIVLDTIARSDRGFSPDPPYYTHFQFPELGPDGRIYYSTSSLNNSNAFHVINRPNLPLFAADFEQRGLILPVLKDDTRTYFPNYRLGRLLGSACDTLPFAGAVEERFDHRWIEEKPTNPYPDTVKVLKLPAHFHLPERKSEAPPVEFFDPLDLRDVTRQAIERSRKTQSEKKSEKENK
ncbi:MAG: hypothetical protein JNJ57_09055 [Saprospiraceae bacterium]|nr:hypothetical protein [Saprospiraceae bacterium]